MDITLRLPAEHINRLLEYALEGSPAKIALSNAIGPDHGGPEPQLHTIICDAAVSEALQRLALRCCTPALTLINQAIAAGYAESPAPSARWPRRR